MEGTPVRGAATPEAVGEVAEEARADLHALARVLRERRRLLGLSQQELGRLAQVSRTVVNQIENAARVPSVRTYARLRAALGLEPPPAAVIPQRLPRRLEADMLMALCAGLVVRPRVALGELASALDISVSAVRENLEGIAERMRSVGFMVTEDGGEIRCWPLEGPPGDVVRCLSVTEEAPPPSSEQVEILALVAYFGPLTRSQVEGVRIQAGASIDSASLLDRMARQGLLARVRSEHGIGGPNLYSVTTKALRATGYPSVDAMRNAIAAQFTPAQLATLHNGVHRALRNGERVRSASPRSGAAAADGGVHTEGG